MKIDNYLSQSISKSIANIKTEDQDSTTNFIGSFSKYLQNVNQNINEADLKISNVAIGKDEDIPGAMIALEKSDISIKMLLSVRNKVLSAYQEITRMPI